ncbi:uncharacterized protein [Nicotiana sylvestris]|uniref:uncharacterized protein n=1 Tax=Nicotiana sylvestris TaxID=4096 RepID=UPI00388C513A
MAFCCLGMDVIGPIEPAASNEHRFILVAIDYFTKWVKAMTFKFLTKKVVIDFVHSNIICRFEIPKVIITDNGANLNSHLMKEVCQQFKITHRNSTLYRRKANGAIKAVNNIKKILQKIVQAEIDDNEWVKTRLEQLSLIDEKRLVAVCQGQLYQKRMARAYNKKIALNKSNRLTIVLSHYENVEFGQALRNLSEPAAGPIHFYGSLLLSG